MKVVISCIAALSLFFFVSCSSRIEQSGGKETTKKNEAVKISRSKTPYDNAQEFIKDIRLKKRPVALTSPVRVDTIIINDTGKSIEVNFNKGFSTVPFREENVREIYSLFRTYLSDKYKEYTLIIKTLDKKIEDLIPNFYRQDKNNYDQSRMAKTGILRAPAIVKNISKPSPSVGLSDKNILVWQSHGWYYNNELDRWEWQRPRLFESVEDKIPLSFVVPYLTPMLENAGANVFLPRERDFQTNEFVADNDNKVVSKNQPSYVEISKKKGISWKTAVVPGFAYGNPPYAEHFNPFKSGTSRYIQVDSVQSAEARWIPDIPETGIYSVYISYNASAENVTDAHYTVFHCGEKTEFEINQQIGGGTWIYLGEFKFAQGYNNLQNMVVLSNKSKHSGKGAIVSGDAVRFGGGMSIVSRNGKTSGRPKYLEGARYWLQYAGMPDTLVYDMNKGKNDYNDDYQSRAEYGNYLYGAPFGPNKNRKEKGLGVPMDLSLAFHTDAGITHNDTVIGTLSIFSTEGAGDQLTFGDGVQRTANRDLADIMQTQIVDDIKSGLDPSWSRRQLMDSDYSEAYRPNFPGILIELLSHQNFVDMQYMLDPRFRFVVARAMYKGMLKFLSTQNRTNYVVQPLPVDHFQALLKNNGVELKWRPVEDPLEATAKPESYMVYTRTGDGDFDNGQLTDTTFFAVKNIKPGMIYSFKITALNKGGESFPSEILAVCNMNNGSTPALIINGFDRICGPAAIKASGYEGFANNEDAGVPDKFDISFTGDQFDFNTTSPFRTNDAPGHGASHADFETTVIAGNTFDFPYIHGRSISANGLSFCSASNEAVWDKFVDLNTFKFIDLILGEQKETHFQKSLIDSLKGTAFKAFPVPFQQVIADYCSNGGNLFISGSYVGTDLFKNKAKDNPDIEFGKKVLKINWQTDHAALKGNILASSSLLLPNTSMLSFNTELNKNIYAVEAPDAFEPLDGARSVFRYSENLFGAGIAYKKDYGLVVLGFPFETIIGDGKKEDLMKGVINYFHLK